MLRLTIALGLMSLLAGPLQAGSLVPNTEPLSTSVQREPVDTIVPIYRAYITADTGKFAFLLPEQFRLGGDPAHGKVQMENAAVGSQITFTLLRSADDTAPDTGRDAYRERLTARYPQARFLASSWNPQWARRDWVLMCSGKARADWSSKRALFMCRRPRASWS